MTTTMKAISKQLLMMALAVGLVFAVSGMMGLEAGAQNTDAAERGLGLTGNDGGANAEADLGGIIEDVIDVLSLLVGAISVIMIIIGGLKYVTSAGDSSGVQSAKNTILYAVVGLVIVVFAQTIVKFVIDRVNGNSGTSETTETDAPDAGGFIPLYVIDR